MEVESVSQVMCPMYVLLWFWLFDCMQHRTLLNIPPEHDEATEGLRLLRVQFRLCPGPLLHVMR